MTRRNWNWKQFLRNIRKPLQYNIWTMLIVLLPSPYHICMLIGNFSWGVSWIIKQCVTLWHGKLNNLTMRTFSTFEYLQSDKTKALPMTNFKSHNINIHQSILKAFLQWAQCVSVWESEKYQIFTCMSVCHTLMNRTTCDQSIWWKTLIVKANSSLVEGELGLAHFSRGAQTYRGKPDIIINYHYHNCHNHHCHCLSPTLSSSWSSLTSSSSSKWQNWILQHLYHRLPWYLGRPQNQKSPGSVVLLVLHLFLCVSVIRLTLYIHVF